MRCHDLVKHSAYRAIESTCHRVVRTHDGSIMLHSDGAAVAGSTSFVVPTMSDTIRVFYAA